jgi:hypothetical protein
MIIYIALALLLFAIIGIVIYSMGGKSSPLPLRLHPDDNVYKQLKQNIEHGYIAFKEYINKYDLTIRKVSIPMHKLDNMWREIESNSGVCTYGTATLLLTILTNIKRDVEIMNSLGVENLTPFYDNLREILKYESVNRWSGEAYSKKFNIEIKEFTDRVEADVNYFNVLIQHIDDGIRTLNKIVPYEAIVLSNDDTFKILIGKLREAIVIALQ